MQKLSHVGEEYKNNNLVIRFNEVSRIFVNYEEDFNKPWIIRSFFKKKKEIFALKDINFEVYNGEILGYVGPNGAGKSTTIKLLLGILVPSFGEVRTFGMDPWKNRSKIVKNIGAVFGQRSGLNFYIPLIESFRFHKSIYGLSDEFFDKRLKELDEIFSLKELFNIPVRKLSLGQRIRSEIALALLHKPKLLVLDEPTIGLDIFNKAKIREYLKRINEKERVTIFLASNDMFDIEALATSIIIINKGKLLGNYSMKEFKRLFMNKKKVELVLENSDIARKYIPKLKLRLLKSKLESFSQIHENAVTDKDKLYSSQIDNLLFKHFLFTFNNINNYLKLTFVVKDKNILVNIFRDLPFDVIQDLTIENLTLEEVIKELLS